MGPLAILLQLEVMAAVRLQRPLSHPASSLPVIPTAEAEICRRGRDGHRSVYIARVGCRAGQISLVS
jgi:hypothetical protein